MLERLPREAQVQAHSAYRLFKQNPFHPSLYFKRLNATEEVYSVRIGLHYRALGRREREDLIVWFWIGTHAEYDKLLHN